jgi:hypothetical protein
LHLRPCAPDLCRDDRCLHSGGSGPCRAVRTLQSCLEAGPQAVVSEAEETDLCDIWSQADRRISSP